MDFSWEHHLISYAHPGVWAAVIVASAVSWFIGNRAAALVLYVRDPWRRVVYLAIPVLVIVVFVLLLPGLVFEAVWMVTHPRNVQADLFMVRHVLVIPLAVALVSAAWHAHGAVKRTRIPAKASG